MLRGELSGIDDVARSLRSINSKQPKHYGGLQFIGIDDVTMSQPQWLWDGMIAKGKLHVFAGESGIGKTQLLCNIAAIVSRGGVFPNAKEPCEAGMVLYLSGEDDLSDTIGPRFIACSGNKDNFRQVGCTKSDGEVFNLTEILDDLTEAVFDKRVKLFIIDPITSFMNENFDNNSVTSVRKMATRLNEFCERTGVAVIALNHLTKGNQSKSMHRILGSGAWVHAPRIVLGATIHDGKYLFGKWKANITDCKPVYQFEMVNKQVQGMDVICIDWLDEVLLDKRLDEYDAFADAGRGEKGEIALAVLREDLSDGRWYRSKEVKERVRREASCSERTVERLALETLKVEVRKESGVHGYTSWRLPPTT